MLARLILSMVVGVVAAAELGHLPEGFTPIFNGKDLQGWHVSRVNHHGKTGDWRVEDGVLVSRQHPVTQGGILLTDKVYRDFEVSLEIKPDWGCDGGLFLRSNEEGRAYQVRIDYLPGGNVGGVSGEGLNMGLDNPGHSAKDWEKNWRRDDWNLLRARITGELPHIVVWLNGVELVDFKDHTNHLIGGVGEGMIALQMHWGGAWIPGGAHRFRNIGIKMLKEAK
jgi:hypothetical protein